MSGRPVYDERDPRLPMSAEDLVQVLDGLECAGVEAWLDGGWGVDALLGEVTRLHDDLDLVVSLDDVPRLVECLAGAGYDVARGEPPLSIVLLDREGRQVDVHPVSFTKAGDGDYVMEDGNRWLYPAAGFRGRGRVLGRDVRCLTPEVQMLCHAGYELDATDHADLAALRERFGVAVPSEGS